MVILTEKVDKEKLMKIEEMTYFEEMMKCVVDVEQEIVAVNASLHSDLEEMMLEHGSKQSSLYGINILYDEWEIEYDSLINTPRNREAGFPRVGRYVADPSAREKIEGVIKKWIQM